jgi:hypothetical protein
MSFVSALFPSEPYEKSRTAASEGGMIKQLHKASEFLRGIRIQMRYGELSRAPLRLLRLQMLENIVECDWVGRSADPWDADLSGKLQQRHASLQALRDAIDVRDLLFDTMPRVSTACLRVYRESHEDAKELIITGYSHRSDKASRDVHSIAMRAKLLGFNFDLEGEVLHKLLGRDVVCTGGKAGIGI